MSVYVLGINAYHGDASACLLRDGQLLIAVEEERFNRKKHTAGFPTQAIRYCLSAAGIRGQDLDHVAISRDPQANLHKKILYTLMKRPSVTGLLKDRLANVAKIRDLKTNLAAAMGVTRKELQARFHNVEHHKCHMASAFLVSPFEKAAVCSIDGFGDFVSTKWGVGAGTGLSYLGQVEFPHSLGVIYTATTQWLGFPRYGDEGKVMGLAPYGEPDQLDKFRQILKLLPGGRFELDLRYFRHHDQGVQMTWDDGSPVIDRIWSDYFVESLGPPREPGSEYTDYYTSAAASLQALLEEGIFHVLNHLHEQTGERALCLAGGVTLNSVANGMIFERTPFEDVFVQPAAGDNGTSLGAAYYVWNEVLGHPRCFEMRSASTGPSFDSDEVAAVLEQRRGDLEGFRVERLGDDEVIEQAAEAISEGQVVGWFQGAMEFGPRALGNRSIVADPRRAEMKDVLNARIKHREHFRPFAPSILEERVGDYFEQDHPSPHMLMVYKTRAEKRGEMGAVNHVDDTGRLQTVSAETAPRYHALISAFERRTGVPIVLNTSFNENEPIVCTPAEGLDCFLRTKMDVLVMENWIITRPSA